jgi:hypothetical protein
MQVSGYHICAYMNACLTLSPSRQAFMVPLITGETTMQIHNKPDEIASPLSDPKSNSQKLTQSPEPDSLQLPPTPDDDHPQSILDGSY